MLNSVKTRILIVEDHPIYLEGLQLILTFSQFDCEIVAQAANVKQAIDWLESHPEGVDLAILDYFLPDGNAIDVLNMLKRMCPKAKALVITGEVERPEVRKAVEGRVDGLISKDVQSVELLKTVASIMNDGIHSGNWSESKKNNGLTRRETEIVRYSAQGKNTREIAEALGISPRTLESHKDSIYSKLGINTNAELIKYAVLNGLL